MIISHKHKFIFIHVPKCAGSSITNALKNYGSVNNRSFYSKILTFLMINEKSPSGFHPHIKAANLKEKLEKNIWKSYYKFAFVRNPFDYQVSNYHYIKRSESHPHHKQVVELEGFREFIIKECHEYLTSRPNVLSRYVYDDMGNLLVDYVGYFEQLNADFEAICKKLDINSSLPHVNKSNRTHYRKYYDDETQKMVEKHHEKDLELFNYTF